MQSAPLALDLALDKAGRSIPARIAMMAMTTRSSIKVKPCLLSSGLSRARCECGIFMTLLNGCVGSEKNCSRTYWFYNVIYPNLESMTHRLLSLAFPLHVGKQCSQPWTVKTARVAEGAQSVESNPETINEYFHCLTAQAWFEMKNAVFLIPNQ